MKHWLRFAVVLRRGSIRVSLAAVVITLGMLAAAGSAHADTFNFTSCHVSGSTCQGGDSAIPFGTVTLTQNGTSVNFTVSLLNGNRFVETGAGGNSLFLFNDGIAGSTITTIATAPNTPAGGLSGATNQAAIMADGTGTFTAQVFCTVASDCNGGSAPVMTSLTFTVTNATLAQLETANANGNMFVADLLCGAAQTNCTGLTGPVDVHMTTTTPEPGTLLLFGSGLLGVAGLVRRRVLN